MSKISSKTEVARKPRADAQRNRLHILEIARKAFARSGADVSMDEVAREAGVGPGTLYRHFPNRDALIEAVYRGELEKLAEAERKLSATLPPLEALRAWMKLFVDYIATKQIISPALNALVASGSDVYECSGTLIRSSIDGLVGRAIASGEMRADTDAMDLLRALFGVATIVSGPGWQENAKRLVDVLLLGSRPTT